MVGDMQEGMRMSLTLGQPRLNAEIKVDFAAFQFIQQTVTHRCPITGGAYYHE